MKKRFERIAAGQRIILVAAVIMMAVGIANGEAQTVLAKAVNICLECIGIG